MGDPAVTVQARRTSGGLGRGLAALIPDASPAGGARELEIAAIRPNPHQPRGTFPPNELRDLADSIAQHGILQPVLVVEVPGGYQLIAGERRLRAAELAGLETIPALVRSAGDQEQLALALVENIQRAELNAMDEARAFRLLVDEFGLTQDQVARQVGRSRPAISNTLRLLEVAPAVQAAVESDVISEGHARALAGLATHAAQETTLATVTGRSLSVRQTEQLVAALRDPRPEPSRRRRQDADADMEHLEAGLRDALGTRVTITAGRRGGRITISWFDDEDLGRICERLTGGDR